MRVLGVVYEHNATVCLVEDGRVVFCQSEERLNRIKNSAGMPIQTLQYVYDRVAPRESIDLAVVFERSIFGFLSMRARGFAPVPGGQYLDPAARRPSLRRRAAATRPGWALRQWRARRTEGQPALRREAHAYFSSALGIAPGKVRYIDHHLGHAWSVVPNVSAWGETLIFTLDGYGDGLCATVSLLKDGRLTRLSADDERHSLGRYYRDTAWILGMKALEDEFKIMALAPYADPAAYEPLCDRLRALLTVEEGRWRSVPNPAGLLYALERLYRFERFDHVAGAIQRLTEELIARWVSHWVFATGCRNIAGAGGVFMNVKAAQRLADLPHVDRLFVMPSAGDESCAVGSAVWGSRALAPDVPLAPLRDLYLGAAFSTRDVERAIAETGAAARYRITRPAALHRAIAARLADNQIVARCSGRMEFGARALGNRSILANAGDPLNARRLNATVKNRDFWMPFAPSILEEEMDRYVENPKRLFAPYMCLALTATAEAQRVMPAAVHARDATLRPQAVRRDWNPAFHDIIAAFRDLTGTGAVLNTSFNLHGEPMVCSPVDAIRTVDRCGIDHLVLEDVLLEKREHAPRLPHGHHAHIAAPA